MRRMDKVFADKGIIFEPDDTMMWRGPEYDEAQHVVEITDKFIITEYDSAVIDPEIRLYDRFTLKRVASQLMFPEVMFGDKTRTWMSWVE